MADWRAVSAAMRFWKPKARSRNCGVPRTACARPRRLLKCKLILSTSKASGRWNSLSLEQLVRPRNFVRRTSYRHGPLAVVGQGQTEMDFRAHFGRPIVKDRRRLAGVQVKHLHRIVASCCHLVFVDRGVWTSIRRPVQLV